MGVGTHSKADCTDRLTETEQTSSIASDEFTSIKKNTSLGHRHTLAQNEIRL